MRKLLLGLGAFVLAFGVLTISVFQSASVAYVFATPLAAKMPVLGTSVPEVDYAMPYAGGVLPDSPLWVFKALRDRIWFDVTTNPLKKAELALLFSDKRLEASNTLLVNKKPDIALSTLTKGEKYLEIAYTQEEQARKEGMDTHSFLIKLALSSLKHRQIIEQDLLPLSPEDAKPFVVKAEDYAKNIYKSSRDTLNNEGITPPKDPFSGD